MTIPPWVSSLAFQGLSGLDGEKRIPRITINDDLTGLEGMDISYLPPPNMKITKEPVPVKPDSFV